MTTSDRERKTRGRGNKTVKSIRETDDSLKRARVNDAWGFHGHERESLGAVEKRGRGQTRHV